jgi:hypothetical protein
MVGREEGARNIFRSRGAKCNEEVEMLLWLEL